MATTSTSALFTRSWWLSNATGTPKSLLAASADSRRLVDSAVISKSSESDFKAGMCASAAHPRSGLAPMMPTRILLSPFLLMVVIPCPCKLHHRGPSHHRASGAYYPLAVGQGYPELGAHRRQGDLDSRKVENDNELCCDEQREDEGQPW